MKKKNMRLIGILALVLGISALYLIYTNTSSTINKELSDFSVRDTASITKVFMSDMNFNSVKLVKIKPGEWVVNDNYEVRNESIVTLFKTLIWIEIREPVPQAHLEQVNALLAATSTKVEIYQTVYFINLFNKIKLFPYEKCTKTFYVGEATADQMGTYMLMEKSTKPFITYMPGFRGFLHSRFSPRENDWRIPRVFDFKLGDIKSVEINFTEKPESSFRIENNNDRTFKLFSTFEKEVKINTYDTLKVLNYMSAFENVNFEAILNHLSKKDSIINSPAFHTINLKTFDGETHVVKTYHKWAIPDEDNLEIDPEYLYDRDRLYALINNGNDFVLIQFYVFDRIFKPLSYFIEPEEK